MRSSKVVLSVLAAGSFIVGSAVASAQEAANLSGCLHMSKEVQSAFAGAQQSQSYDAAREAQKAGQEFCSAGFYARGIASYRDALTDLGQAMNNSGQNKS